MWVRLRLQFGEFFREKKYLEIRKGIVFSRAMFSFFGFQIQWAAKTAEKSNAKMGVLRCTEGEKRKQKQQKVVGVNKKTCIFDFVKKKRRLQKSVF